MTEGNKRDDAEEGEEEGEGLREIGEAEGDAHQCRVAEMRGGEMAEKSGDCEEEKCHEERVGAHLAEAELALAGDDEEADAEIAEGVTIEEEWSGVCGCRAGFAELRLARASAKAMTASISRRKMPKLTM